MKNMNFKVFYSLNTEVEKVILTDEYGFINKNNDLIINTNFNKLKLKWYKLLTKYQNDNKLLKKEILKYKLIQQGIPLSLKYKVYTLLINKANLDYEKYKRKKSKFEYEIHLDVQRTCRHHFLFNKKFGKGQCELFNVLTGISNYYPEIGYCQGMSDILAVLLMYFNEKESFEYFISIIEKNHLKNLFDQKLTKVPKLIKIQNKIFKRIIPKIVYKLREEMHTYVLIGWYMTFFTRFNIKIALRIWDYFIFYNFEILIYIAGSVLEYFEKEILNKDEEEIIEFISKIEQKEIDVDKLMNIIEKNIKIYNGN